MGTRSIWKQYKSTRNQLWPLYLQIMKDFDKTNSLNSEDRELLSDLKLTFDLGTQTIIGRDEDEIVDDLVDLMSEAIDD